MKKITLLVAVLTATFTYAQKVYDFTGSANPGSWVAAGNGISVTPSADGLVFEFNAGTPRIEITRAADPFDVSVGTHMLVTIVNNSSEVGSFSGMFDKNGAGETGTQFLGFEEGVVSGEVTYLYELSSNNYLNDPGNSTFNDSNSLADMELLGVRFRNASGSALTGDSATNGNVVIKRIEVLNAGDSSKIAYDFSKDDVVSFGDTGGGTVSDGGSTLKLTTDNTNKSPKITQEFYSVDASTNKYVYINVDSNTTNADEIKFQFVDAGDVVQTFGVNTLTMPIELDLSSKAEWTGTIKEWRIVFSNSGDANVNVGDIEISEITFAPNTKLSSNTIEDVNFSLYPNPVSDVLNITSTSAVAKIAVYNITGQKVLESNGGSQVNVSQLASGVYLIKLSDENNNILTKKFIKK